MRDSDFYALVTMLDQVAARSGSKECHADLVEQVRTHFPDPVAGRYRALAEDLLAMQEDDTPLYRISPRYEDNDFNSKFGEARRGNEKRFRALLLKWLWAHHPDEARVYLDRWGVSIPERVNKELCHLPPMLADIVKDTSLRQYAFEAVRKELRRNRAHYALSADRVDAILQ